MDLANSGFTDAENFAGPKPWKLHVPVRLTVFKSVVVTTRALPRDGLLTAADVSLAERVSACAGPWQRARLSPRAPWRWPLARRSEQVNLHARSGGMQIRMAGMVRADGIQGQVIAVKNFSSGREVEGIVRSAKSVEVLLQ